MLDSKYLRYHFDEAKEKLLERNVSEEKLDYYYDLIQRRLKLLPEIENIRRQKNVLSKQINEMKKQQLKVEDEIKEVRELNKNCLSLENELEKLNEVIHNKENSFPNFLSNRLDSLIINQSKACIQTNSKNSLSLDFFRGEKVSGRGMDYIMEPFSSEIRRIVNKISDFVTAELNAVEIHAPILVNKEALNKAGLLPFNPEQVIPVSKSRDLNLSLNGLTGLINFHQASTYIDGSSRTWTIAPEFIFEDGENIQKPMISYLTVFSESHINLEITLINKFLEKTLTYYGIINCTNISSAADVPARSRQQIDCVAAGNHLPIIKINDYNTYLSRRTMTKMKDEKRLHSDFSHMISVEIDILSLYKTIC